jgi:hypothetical protein
MKQVAQSHNHAIATFNSLLLSSSPCLEGHIFNEPDVRLCVWRPRPHPHTTQPQPPQDTLAGLTPPPAATQRKYQQQQQRVSAGRVRHCELVSHGASALGGAGHRGRVLLALTLAEGGAASAVAAPCGAARSGGGPRSPVARSKVWVHVNSSTSSADKRPPSPRNTRLRSAALAGETWARRRDQWCLCCGALGPEPSRTDISVCLAPRAGTPAPPGCLLCAAQEASTATRQLQGARLPSEPTHQDGECIFPPGATWHRQLMEREGLEEDRQTDRAWEHARTGGNARHSPTAHPAGSTRQRPTTSLTSTLRISSEA